MTTATQNCAALILAAGSGTRMKSTLPKVLHKLASEPMIVHVARAATALNPARLAAVVAPGMEAVRAALKHYPTCKFAVQEKQQGTGHAVLQAREALMGFKGTVLILFGDTPLITPEILERMLDAAKSAQVVVLGARMSNPTGYGRLVLAGDGSLARIVECRDATPLEKALTLCNAGAMAVSSEHLFALLEKLENRNASGEYYLTDIVAQARAQNLNCAVVEGAAEEVMGINSRTQLAEAEAYLQKRLRARALENGVTLVAPETVFFCADTVLGKDVVVQPYVVFGPGVRVGDAVEIRSFCHIEAAEVEHSATLGPYARLRPQAHIEAGAHIGNFVEIKKSRIGHGAKVNHLSYVGDAEVGANANIGAGVITCNYDGVLKHKTTIGESAFIGSNAALVAPVAIGAHALVGAGSVITENVPANALAIARGQQVVKKKN